MKIPLDNLRPGGGLDCVPKGLPQSNQREVNMRSETVIAGAKCLQTTILAICAGLLMTLLSAQEAYAQPGCIVPRGSGSDSCQVCRNCFSGTNPQVCSSCQAGGCIESRSCGCCQWDNTCPNGTIVGCSQACYFNWCGNAYQCYAENCCPCPGTDDCPRDTCRIACR